MCNFSHWPILSLLSPQVTSTIKFAVVFGTGKETIFVTVDDKVWVTGGKHLAQPFLIDKLSNLGVIDIRPGFASMFIALTKNGEVYYCGIKNPSPAVPFAAEPTDCISFGRIGLHDKKVIKVACGISHAVAVTEAGEVFFWGVQIQLSQVKVSSGENDIFVKDAECSQNFTILLSDKGQAYCFLCNVNYLFGIGNNTNQQNPVKIPGIDDVFVSQVVCGCNHAMFLSSDGHIYGWAITRTNEVYVWGYFGGQRFLKPHLTSLNCIDDVFSCLTEACVSFRPLTNEGTSANSRMDCYSGSVTAANSLLGSLKSSFDDPKTSDVTFVIEEKQIRAHKSLLKIRCEHFRLMFQEAAWLEGGKKEIEITHFSYPVYKAFLYYLYTDELDITPESAIGLLDLATYYLEHELKLKCTEKIKKMISIENALMFYDAFRSCNLNDLEEFCLSFCLKNTSAVTQTEHFKNLDEETLKHFVIEISKRGAYKN